jgi:C4-dicarboxylate transporter/malic acid transport protein
MKEGVQMSNVIKTFAPSWPATVMGTAVLPIALNLSAASLPWMKDAAIAFFFLSLAMLAVITLIDLARLVAYPVDFVREFSHPVAGSFLPTLPIAFVIVAIDFLTLGAPLFGEGASRAIAVWLFGFGTAGIWIIGLLAISSLFASTEVKQAHATFGWFIPAVSQIVIAIGGLELVKHLERGAAADFVFVLSIAGLGIGTVLFLLLGPNVYGRYIFSESPGPKMAPTAAIGFSPTAVITIALAKLAAVQGVPTFAAPNLFLSGILGFMGLAAWGFSAFGFLLAILVIGRGFKAMRSNFGLPWWAMTFPLGAFAVASGAIGKLLGTDLFQPVLVGLTLLLLLVWAVVAVGTLRGIGNGTIFARD